MCLSHNNKTKKALSENYVLSSTINSDTFFKWQMDGHKFAYKFIIFGIK